MRVFIAVELEYQVKDQLKNVQEQIKNYTKKGSFTKQDNFHLTLRFIKDVNREEINSIKKAIDETSSKTKPFKLSLNNLGNFPKGNKEILWMGVKGQLDTLDKLYLTLEETLEEKGFEKEKRPYRPHITLGRQLVLDENLDKFKEKLQLPEAKIKVNKISLMESKRVSGELVYQAIYQKNL